VSNTPQKNKTTAPMTGNSSMVAHHLRRSLNDDSQDLTSMLDLLTNERKALESNQPSQLKELTQQKNIITERMEQRHRERITVLETNNFSQQEQSWRPAIKQIELASGLPLIGLWNNVEAQLSQCAELLAINEKIIANMRQNVNQLMNSLRGQVGSGQTYNAEGKAKTFADSKPFASA